MTGTAPTRARTDVEATARAAMEAWANADLDTLETLHAADYVNRTADFPSDRASIIALAATTREAFPDLTVRVVQSVTEGDRVALLLRWRGTHRGEFNGIPASGNTIEIDTMTMFRVADGRIAERWGAIDWLDFTKQLGVQLAPAAP